MYTLHVFTPSVFSGGKVYSWHKNVPVESIKRLEKYSFLKGYVKISTKKGEIQVNLSECFSSFKIFIILKHRNKQSYDKK